MVNNKECEMDEDRITNKDLYDRMTDLERKVDTIFQKLEQATGAWTFIKIICSVAFGAAVIWNSVAAYLERAR